jgi:hypothetical protein
MPLDDLLRDRKSNTVAVVLRAPMQALEHLKNQLAIFFVDSDPVVLDTKQPIAVAFLGADVDVRQTIAVKLQRISDQVLKHLRQLRFVGGHRRKFVTHDFGVAFVDRDLEAVECAFHRDLGIDFYRHSALRAAARIGEQILDQLLHALGAVERKFDVFLGLFVARAFVVLGQQLGVGRDHAQRLLQVVRGNIGELRQIFI